ncbi:MAG: response regulator [Gammaproteobacteria bacterium]|nr:response regulator [Gammaproteobacteria bacterium]
MNQFGIKRVLLIISIVPMLVLGISLSAYFTASRVNDLVQSLEERGLATAIHMAQSAEYAVLSGNKDVLNGLVAAALSDNDIYTASIYGIDGDLLSTIKRKGNNTTNSHDYSNSYDSRKSYRQSNDDSIIFSEVITTTNVDVYDMDDSETTSDENEIIGHITIGMTKRFLKKRQNEVLLSSLGITVIGLYLAMILGVHFSKRIVDPIVSLTKTVRNIGHGNLSMRADTHGTDELGELQRGINQMASSLETNDANLKEQVKIATSRLVAQIEEIESKNTQLDAAQKEAKQGTRIKSEFLAKMSHEIRTPLNGISGFIELLGETVLNTRQKEFIDIIRQSSDDLIQIINEILDFSKIEAGKMTINPTTLDILSLLETTTSLLTPATLSKNVSLHLIPYGDLPPSIIIDGLKLKQILINLIGNAIKFTDKGFISIRVYNNSDSSLTIVIRDTGIGIPKKQQSEIFKEFSQISEDTLNREPGTGLGLLISKYLVEKMGGTLDLTSIRDEGTTFTVNLPYLLPENSTESHEQPEPTKSALIISPSEESQAELRSILQYAGFAEDVLVIGDEIAESFNSALQKHTYDLIAVDLSDQDLFSEYFKSSIYSLYFDTNIKCIGFRRSKIGENLYPGKYFDFIVDFISSRETIKNQLNVLFEATESNTIRQNTGESTTVVKLASDITILVVDDNEINRHLICTILEQWEVDFVEAIDGLEAVEKTFAMNPDVILMDIHMPNMHGTEAFTVIKNKLGDKRPKIIALTANALQEERDRVLELGMDDYITKPITKNTLLAAIDGVTTANSDTGISMTPDKNLDQLIDTGECLRLSDGNTALAEELLTILKTQLPADQDKMNAAHQANDMKALTEVIHRIHGATCYTGIPILKQQTSNLELELRKNNVKNLVTKMTAINTTIESFIVHHDENSPFF